MRMIRQIIYYRGIVAPGIGGLWTHLTPFILAQMQHYLTPVNFFFYISANLSPRKYDRNSLHNSTNAANSWKSNYLENNIFY